MTNNELITDSCHKYVLVNADWSKPRSLVNLLTGILISLVSTGQWPRFNQHLSLRFETTRILTHDTDHAILQNFSIFLPLPFNLETPFVLPHPVQFPSRPVVIAPLLSSSARWKKRIKTHDIFHKFNSCWFNSDTIIKQLCGSTFTVRFKSLCFYSQSEDDKRS